jgi:hypothetical protein
MQRYGARGNLISEKMYLYDCFIDIFSSLSAKFYVSGEINKTSHPKHPLYLKETTKFKQFDIKGYIDMISNRIKLYDTKILESIHL